MATGATTPDGISFLQTGSTVDPVSESAVQASSIQNALNKRPFYQFIWTNGTGRTSQTGMRQGDLGFQIDTSVSYQYISSAIGWQPTPFGTSRTLAGVVSITPSASGSIWKGTTAVTFPTNFFPSTPNVLTNPSSSFPERVNSSAANVSVSGFTAVVSRTDAATLTAIYWMAIL